MPMLARYHRETGQIVGVWTAPYRELLHAQQMQDDATYGSLEVEEQDARVLEAQMEVQHGQLVARQLVTITALARRREGEAVCQITLEPWHPCTLRVNGRAYGLTETQRALEVPFETVRMLEILLMPVPGIWAQPVQVEAPTTEQDRG